LRRRTQRVLLSFLPGTAIVAIRDQHVRHALLFTVARHRRFTALPASQSWRSDTIPATLVVGGFNRSPKMPSHRRPGMRRFLAAPNASGFTP
jgi:hypothetical protein